ncbi:MAG: hypothetical protein AAF738_01980 [Bacteroidota bacterium]
MALLFTLACESPVYAPKPRAYPKVNYPEREYVRLDKDYCAFSFEYPSYMNVVQDKRYFDEESKHECWFDLYMEAFDSRLHCTYYPIQSRDDFEKLLVDAFELAGKHNSRADYIEERPIQQAGNVKGFGFEIEGPAASPFQFFVTDSTQHFFRASLYFNTQARPDSLAPVYQFVKHDINKIIETFQWQQK